MGGKPRLRLPVAVVATNAAIGASLRSRKRPRDPGLGREERAELESIAERLVLEFFERRFRRPFDPADGARVAWGIAEEQLVGEIAEELALARVHPVAREIERLADRVKTLTEVAAAMTPTRPGAPAAIAPVADLAVEIGGGAASGSAPEADSSPDRT